MSLNQRPETESSAQHEEPGVPAGCCGVAFADPAGDASTACRPPTAMGEATQPRSQDPAAMTGCPMAKMCGGLMKGGTGSLGGLMLIPAALLLTLGAAILLAPQILTWLVAGGLILAGGLGAVAAYQLRRLGNRAV